MRLMRRAWLCLALALGGSVDAEAQALLRLVMPECAAPGSTVWMEVRAELQSGQTLKSYDVRIPFDPTQISFDEGQIQQGSWFTAGGSTFFWHDILDNTLYVNAAILGPNLHVTGAGTLFRLPLTLNQPTLLDLQASVHDLFNRYAQPLPVLDFPAAMQAPCTDLSVSAHLDFDPIPQLHLIWNAQSEAQEWLDAYRVYSRQRPEDSWELEGSTLDTQWTTPLRHERRLYQIRALFTGAP